VLSYPPSVLTCELQQNGHDDPPKNQSTVNRPDAPLRALNELIRSFHPIVINDA